MYQLKRVTSREEFRKNIENNDNFVPISILPWGGEYRPECRAMVCSDFTNGGLWVYLEAIEHPNDMRITQTEPDGSVWQDSCLEIFISPIPGKGYFNFENNALGTMLCGVHVGETDGQPGGHRMSDFGMVATRTYIDNGLVRWSVEFFLPWSYFRRWLPEFDPKPGDLMKVNFYKCGDKTPRAHYLCWNRVGYPQISFHRPEYFGDMTV